MTSITSPLSDTGKRGLELKNEGNDHFVKRRFAAALSKYSAGISVVTQNGDDDDVGEDLAATLLSNRSSCYYEMGDYENSIVDAQNAAQMIMESWGKSIKAAHDRGESGDIKMPSLIQKNIFRKARAMHFCNAEDSEIHDTLHLLEKDQDCGEYASMAAKMREQLNYYLNMPSSNNGFEPWLLRASFQNPYFEYYNFGHDESESLLRRNEGSNADSIILDELDDDELSSLSFLFGGVGDGRHVFATLLDAHQQYQSLSESKQEKFCLHMMLNDISVQLLAKDALVLVLSHELGATADCVKTALTTADPFNIGMVLYYVTLGYAMPRFVHQKMVSCIKRWFIDSSREVFTQTFPWLFIAEDTWEGIVEKMNAWVDPEKHYSPKLPSTRMMLSRYDPSGDDQMNNAMSELSSFGASNGMMRDMQAKIDSVMDQRRSQVKEMLQSDLSADMIDKAKGVLGEDATKDDIENYFVEILTRHVMEGSSSMYVSLMDKLFMECTKCLNPQFGPSDEIEEELSHFILGGDDEWGSSKEEATKAIETYMPYILDNWITNPVQIDPSFHSHSNGLKATDRFNPVQEWTKGYLTDEVISFMLEPPAKLKTTQTDEEKKKVVQSNSLAFNLIRYYWHVGKALGDLTGKTTIEISSGNIITFGQVRNPTKYHRISLSNVPDYIGMMSVFIALAPLLASKSKAITPCIQSNCLLNTGFWKSYDDYIFSTVALGYKEAESIFRLKVANEKPSVWGPFTVWEQVDDDVKSDDGDRLPLPHEELRTWLHRLYMLTILPADRDINSQIREEKASNVNLFLLALSHCVTRLGAPPHFIASVLEDLLKRMLVTKATLTNESPAPYLDSKDTSKKRYNLSAFNTELANQTAIFIQNSMLGFRLLDTSILPVQKASFYELKLGGITSTYRPNWAYKYGHTTSAMNLGFILQKKQSSEEYGISTSASDGGNTNPMFMVMAMMQGGEMTGSQKKQSKLRRDLLSSGDKIGHVFSCMHWNLANQTASFWLCDDVFEKFSGYFFQLIRTDGWFILPHKAAKLGDAMKRTV